MSTQIFILVVIFYNFENLSGARRRLDEYEVARAVQLLENGTRQSEVARRFNVHPSVICRLWHRYQETGLYVQRPRSGRPRALTARQDRYLTTMARRNRAQSAVVLRNNLQNSTPEHRRIGAVFL